MSALRGALRTGLLVALVSLTACGDDTTGGLNAAPPPPPGRVAPPTVSPAATRSPSARTAPHRVTPPKPAPAVKKPVAAKPTRVPIRVPAEIALPAHDGAVPLMLWRGTPVVADARLGCVWVVVNGRTYPALWPPGYRARLSPLRIYDAQGVVVWREGEVHDIGGGSSHRVDVVPEQCRRGSAKAWLVGSVEPRTKS